MEFPLHEYEGRTARARALMAEAGLDALMVTGDYTAAPNYLYFTGHVPRDYQSNAARPHLFLLTREGEAAICVHFFSEAPARACWAKNIHVYTQPFRHTDALALFRILGLVRGRVGVELGLRRLEARPREGGPPRRAGKRPGDGEGPCPAFDEAFC